MLLLCLLFIETPFVDALDFLTRVIPNLQPTHPLQRRKKLRIPISVRLVMFLPLRRMIWNEEYSLSLTIISERVTQEGNQLELYYRAMPSIDWYIRNKHPTSFQPKQQYTPHHLPSYDPSSDMSLSAPAASSANCNSKLPQSPGINAKAGRNGSG